MKADKHRDYNCFEKEKKAMKSLKVLLLQRENERALLKFWMAVERVRQCREDLHRTPQSLALREAEFQRDTVEAEMSKARMAFLKARTPR
jgi:hypothetical protein